MKLKFFHSIILIFFVLLVVGSFLVFKGGITGMITGTPPQITNNNANLLENYSQSDWKFFFNGTVTTTEVNNGSYAFNISDYRDAVLTRACYESEYVSLEPYKPYTFSGYMKTDSVPTYIQINTYFYNTTSSLPDSSGKGSLYAANTSGEWEEFNVVFTYPANGTTSSGADMKCMRIEVSKPSYPGSGQVAESAGTNVYVADFTLKEGFGTEQAPTQKQNITTNNTRVDSLGNIEFWNGSDYDPVFPLAVYYDTNQNAIQTYSDQGFHAIISRISSVRLDDVAAATSTFNPNGMYFYGSLSAWTDSRLDMYNNIAELSNRLTLIMEDENSDRFMFIDWDDESYNQSEVLVNVTDTIDSNITSGGMKLAPTMVLLGNPGMSRYIKNFADTLSTYVNSHGSSVNHYPPGDLIYVDNLNKQTMPYGHSLVTVSCDEFSAEYIRAVSYSAIAKGAKGLTFFRDGSPSDYPSCAEENMSLQRFWSEIPNIRNETEQLINIIRQPHWTNWSLQSDDGFVVVGTREYNATGYAFIVNLHNYSYNSTFSITGMNYSPTVIKDFFSNSEIANISEDSFNISLDAYEVYVVKLLAEETENLPPDINITSPTNGSSFVNGTIVVLNASASDDVGISFVEFYRNGSLLYNYSSSPYNYSWESEVGYWNLTAIAYDISSESDSASVFVLVNESVPNVVPSVSIVSPPNSSPFSNASSVTINASASDTDGSIGFVEFYANSSLIGNDSSEPYSVSNIFAVPGIYMIFAVAHDNDSATTNSSAIYLNISDWTIQTVLTLNATPSWSIMYGNSSNVTCAADNPYVNLTLYKNNTLVDSGANSTLFDDGTLLAGAHNYSCNASMIGNYTSAFESRILSVSSNLTILFNYSGYVNYTNFTTLNNSQLINVSNVLFRNDFASITFLENLSFNRNLDLNNNFLLANNSIFINSSEAYELNVSANLTFYNINMSYPVPYRDNLLCDSNMCTQREYNNTNLSYSFTVQSFSNFSVQEASCGDGSCNGVETCSSCSPDCGACPVPAGSGGGGGGGGGSSVVTVDENTTENISTNSSNITQINVLNQSNETANISITENSSQNNQSPRQEGPSEINEPTEEFVQWWWFVIAVVVIGAIIVAFILLKAKYESKEIPKDLLVYIKTMRKKGFKDAEIIAKLKSVGWSDDIISKVFKK